MGTLATLLLTLLGVSLGPAGLSEDTGGIFPLAFTGKWTMAGASAREISLRRRPRVDDQGWVQVDLPHDWSSEGPFSAEYDSGNGYAPGGIGWYRKHFRLEPDLKNKAANPPAEQLVTCGRPLIAAVKALDSTRPVTAALANVAMSDAVGLGEMLDVVGYDYQEGRYAADHQKYPKRFIFGSEKGSQFVNWLMVRTNDYVAGQFLWTGIDYLGEAVWPAMVR